MGFSSVTLGNKQSCLLVGSDLFLIWVHLGPLSNLPCNYFVHDLAGNS